MSLAEPKCAPEEKMRALIQGAFLGIVRTREKLGHAPETTIFEVALALWPEDAHKTGAASAQRLRFVQEVLNSLGAEPDESTGVFRRLP